MDGPEEELTEFCKERGATLQSFVGVKKDIDGHFGRVSVIYPDGVTVTEIRRRSSPEEAVREACITVLNSVKTSTFCCDDESKSRGLTTEALANMALNDVGEYYQEITDPDCRNFLDEDEMRRSLNGDSEPITEHPDIVKRQLDDELGRMALMRAINLRTK